MRFAKSKAFQVCCVLMIALVLMAQQPVVFSVPQHVILDAGANVVGHVIADSGSTTAVTGNVASTVADGANVTLGAKADAKSTATDTTAITVMSVLKEISAMEQAPASRAVTQSGNWTSRVVGNAGGLLDAIGQNVAAPANWLSIGCDFFTSPTTITTGNGSNLECDSAGNLLVNLKTAIPAGSNVIGHVITDSGSTTVVTGTVTANATLSAETTKVIGTVRAQGNLGAAFDAATGAAPPANAVLAGGLGSGATGGDVIAIPVGDTYKNINISTATTTLLVTGVASRQVRITALHMVTALANNVALIEGTGATCGTGTAGMAGGTSAASGYNLAANGGMTLGSGLGTVVQTATTGDSVCAVTSAATQLSGGIEYAIY